MITFYKIFINTKPPGKELTPGVFLFMIYTLKKLISLLIILSFFVKSIGIDYTLNAIRYPLSEDTLRPMAFAVTQRHTTIIDNPRVNYLLKSSSAGYGSNSALYNIRNKIVQLGNPADTLLYGSKATAFKLLKKIGCVFPEGLVISRELIEAISRGETAPLKAVVAELARQLDIDKGVSVRSSPITSMPGMLNTILDIKTEADLESALRAVATSWFSEKATEFRKLNNISHEYGQAIIVQVMVYGDKNDNSCTGVYFTRSPSFGNKGRDKGSFLMKSKGDLLVSGKRKGTPMYKMSKHFHSQYEELVKIAEAAENVFGFPQEIEFTIEDGQLYILQSRDIRFAPQAAAKAISDLREEYILSDANMLPRIERLQKRLGIRQLYKIPKNPDYGGRKEVICMGKEGVTRGAMVGKLVFSVEKALQLSKEGKPVILVATEQMRDNIINNIAGIKNVGMAMLYGDESSHEVVLARAAGIPAVIVSSYNVTVENNSLYRNRGAVRGEISVKEGDEIVLDADRGEVFICSLVNPWAILQKDEVVLDAAYGLDIAEYKKSFAAQYLQEDRKTIQDTITYEKLLMLNAQKQREWQERSRQPIINIDLYGYAFPELKEKRDREHAKSMLQANIEKNVLHNLLYQRGIEKGKTRAEVDSDLDRFIEVQTAEIADKEAKNKEHSILTAAENRLKVLEELENNFISRITTAIPSAIVLPKFKHYQEIDIDIMKTTEEAVDFELDTGANMELGDSDSMRKRIAENRDRINAFENETESDDRYFVFLAAVQDFAQEEGWQLVICQEDSGRQPRDYLGFTGIPWSGEKHLKRAYEMHYRAKLVGVTTKDDKDVAISVIRRLFADIYLNIKQARRQLEAYRETRQAKPSERYVENKTLSGFPLREQKMLGESTEIVFGISNDWVSDNERGDDDRSDCKLLFSDISEKTTGNEGNSLYKLYYYISKRVLEFCKSKGYKAAKTEDITIRGGRSFHWGTAGTTTYKVSILATSTDERDMILKIIDDAYMESLSIYPKAVQVNKTSLSTGVPKSHLTIAMIDSAA
jgi:hypothetical protein